MKIEKIIIENEGYIYCQSCFYSSQDGLSANAKYCFSTGLNKLYGEIDAGVWAVSYLLSMYNCKPKDFVLFNSPKVIINDTVMSLDDFSRYACYMDRTHPLFSTNNSIRKLITKGIHKNKLGYKPEEIRDLFQITSERFERPLTSVGNEVFKAMAAIAYSHEKQVYCFPWLSKKRFDNYHNNLIDLLAILEQLNKIIVLPIGNSKV